MAVADGRFTERAGFAAAAAAAAAGGCVELGKAREKING